MKITFLFIILKSSICFAQNTVEETPIIDLIKEIGTQSVISSLYINPIQVESTFNQSNSIYIEQIGNNNTINVNATNDRGTLDLIQAGNNNSMRLSTIALSAMETFRQIGNDHHIATYGVFSSENLERTVNQTGNGQNLIIHGNNSLSEKIQLDMKGVSSTIIIRNFN